MEGFCLEERLREADRLIPGREYKPVIGLTTNYTDADAVIRDRYYLQIIASGGVPMLLPPADDAGVLLAYLDRIDGLMLTGGGDCDPRWAGEEPSELLGTVNETRDLPELLLARMARNRQMPLLGICRGIQIMAIAFGGHVAQDISLDPHWQREKGVVHSQEQPRDVKTHKVLTDENSLLRRLFGCKEMAVNSFHHQTVDVVPPGFRAVAMSEDGVTEAMESAEEKPMLGVQWHPEWLAEDGKPVFGWLVREAYIYNKVKTLHENIISVDSHCDTPMFFPQGADFTKRDGRIKTDLYKMTEGLLDVSTMAAYVPQPVGNETWKDVAPIAADSPFDYVNIIFDRTEALLSSSEIPVALARKPEDAAANKQQGRKSIMLAIENALAIGDDISRAEHFKKRGAVYFTLCHNGDNQVCDSARKSADTWHGLSPFGEKLVKEMNRLGVMIDLSHAGERSFYDVLALSKSPVVCSHSNCRAVCSHERNLTDDQLRRLARSGGVCQLTLYDGFVCRNPKEADILSFVKHVTHAAKIAGIEHIGIGSDFDGDGGIRGLNDSGEMRLFTRQLLEKRFSDEDIRLIWGGNWLRVMGENQKTDLQI